MFEKKCWGEVWHIFTSDHAAVSHLKLVAGFCCSIHKHLERANMFAVLSGRLVVEVWEAGSIASFELGPGDTHTVRSCVRHRFTVLEDGEAIEVYWPDHAEGRVRQDDIVRYSLGGAANGQYS